jgi:hypothetical protein
MRRFAFACALLCACAEDYSGLDVELLSSPPGAVFVGSDEIELPLGVAVRVHTEPQSARREYDRDVSVKMVSQDPSVLEVFRSDGRRNHVLVGVREGQTCVVVYVDAVREDCIPARVRAAAPAEMVSATRRDHKAPAPAPR